MAANEDKEGDQLGLKDLFSKELWLITVVMWLAWPVGMFSSSIFFFFAVTMIIVTVTMGYYGITFGMANLSDDIFTNFIVSSIIGELFNVLSHLPLKKRNFPRDPGLHPGPAGDGHHRQEAPVLWKSPLHWHCLHHMWSS